MRLRPTGLLLLLLPLAGVLLGVWIWGLSLPIDLAPLPAVRPQADAQRIDQWAAGLAAAYPERPLGTPAHTAAQHWLAAEFTALGYVPFTHTFTVTVASRQIIGQNTWIALPGASGASLLVVVPFDTLPHAHPDFDDNAREIATVLELARALAFAERTHHWIFLITDAAQYGPAQGQTAFLETSPLAPTIVAALELDDSQRLSHPQLISAGFQRGYAAPALRAQTERALSAAGLDVPVVFGLSELVARPLPLELTPTGVLNRAGLSAMRLQIPPDQATRTVARAIETWLYALDGQTRPALSDPNDWRVMWDRYIPGPMMPVLALTLLMPVVGGLLWLARDARLRLRTLWPEPLVLVGLLVTGLNGFAFAFLLGTQGFLPRYGHFPAHPGAGLLLQPIWWVALLIYGPLCFTAWIAFRPSSGFARLGVIVPSPDRRVILLTAFLLLALITAWFNPIAALVLLIIPAYAWWWIAPRAGWLGKALNLYLALVGALPLLLWIGQWDKDRFGLWWWWLPMGVAYQTFTLPEALFFVMLLALTVRFALYGWRAPALPFTPLSPPTTPPSPPQEKTTAEA